MCDEYYDERVRTFRRATTGRSEVDELEDELNGAFAVPLVDPSADVEKRKAKPLLR